jgi:hypothetical protein
MNRRESQKLKGREGLRGAHTAHESGAQACARKIASVAENSPELPEFPLWAPLPRPIGLCPHDRRGHFSCYRVFPRPTFSVFCRPDSGLAHPNFAAGPSVLGGRASNSAIMQAQPSSGEFRSQPSPVIPDKHRTHRPRSHRLFGRADLVFFPISYYHEQSTPPSPTPTSSPRHGHPTMTSERQHDLVPQPGPRNPGPRPDTWRWPAPRPNEPCVADLWHGGGAPTPCTGWARGRRSERAQGL